MADRVLEIHEAIRYTSPTLLKMVDNGDGTWTLGASVQESALPSGAATSAKQDTLAALVATAANQADYALRVARGLVSGITSVNKFGKAPDGLQASISDIWSRANAATTQQIWVAPTQARRHQLLSTSDEDSDTGGAKAQGTGARTVRVYGLKTWDLAETSEDVIMDGTSTSGAAVYTVQTYVIIHRMKVLTMGSAGPNVGTITAIAESDASITAVIIPGEGQTEMAIYGVPSIQNFYMTRWSCAMGKSATTQSASFDLRVNENPNVQLTGFLLKNDIELVSTGTSGVEKHFSNPIKYSGPCIIKVQGLASTTDVDAKAAFDGYLVTE